MHGMYEIKIVREMFSGSQYGGKYVRLWDVDALAANSLE